MTSCPWLREHGFTAEGARHLLDEHVLPSAMDAAEAVQAAADRVVDEARARPLESLLIAASLGFVLGVLLTSSRR